MAGGPRGHGVDSWAALLPCPPHGEHRPPWVCSPLCPMPQLPPHSTPRALHLTLVSAVPGAPSLGTDELPSTWVTTRAGARPATEQMSRERKQGRLNTGGAGSPDGEGLCVTVLKAGLPDGEGPRVTVLKAGLPDGEGPCVTRTSRREPPKCPLTDDGQTKVV